MRIVPIAFLLLFVVGCSEPSGSGVAGYQKGKQDGRAEAQEASYKQGQIDALTGKIKYRLTEHEDHTLSWDAAQQNATTNSVKNRTAMDVPYLVPMNDGHGGYIYVPMQELTEKVEK